MSYTAVQSSKLPFYQHEVAEAGIHFMNWLNREAGQLKLYQYY